MVNTSTITNEATPEGPVYIPNIFKMLVMKKMSITNSFFSGSLEFFIDKFL